MSGWQRRFDEPIALPNGSQLLTFRDAATYATKLPKTESAGAEWLAAIEALMLVAELGGPTMFARIGVMRALNAKKAPANPVSRARRSVRKYKILR